MCLYRRRCRGRWLVCRSRQRRPKEVYVITTEVLGNNNRRKDRTISECCYFAIACISNPFIKSACLLDMRPFVGWVIHYEKKMVEPSLLGSVKHTGDKPYSKC